LGLFFASLLLRLVGIGWGLPNDLHNQSYHPDEMDNYGYSQKIDLAKGQLCPGKYSYGSAYYIAENIVDKVVTAYGGEPPAPAGQPTPSDIKAFWRYIGNQILGGRILSALAGAGMVVVVWLILRRITTQFGSLFGAALVGIAPGFLVHSRFETVDVFATFWLGLSALFGLRVLGAMPDSLASVDARVPRDMRDAVLAGLFAGVSAGTKYTGVLVILVLWMCLGLTRRPGWWKAVAIGTVVSFAAFVATTPGFVWDSAQFWKDFNFEVIHTSTGHGLVFAGTPSGFIYHFGNLIVGLGLFATIAGIVGLAYGCYRKHAWAIALVVFAVVYYVVIGRAEVKFMRYTFPLLLPLAVAYGYGMGTAFRRKGRAGHTLAVLGVFALTGNPFIDFGGLIGGVHYTHLMSARDPRDESAIYLQQVAAQGTVGLVKDPWFWSPALIPDAGLNRGQLKQIYSELAETQHPKVIRYLPTDGSPPMDWDLRLITESKPDYIVFSSFEAADEIRLTEVSNLDSDTQGLVDRYKAFITELEKDYVGVSAFGGMVPEIHDLMYIRPTVWVWKRKGLK
jgi:hypothetical protein